MEEAKAGGLQGWWVADLCRCFNSDVRSRSWGYCWLFTPCPIPSFLLIGPSCFAVNLNSHGSTLKHRTGAKQAASGTKTEMNRAGGKKTEEPGKSELVVGVGPKEQGGRRTRKLK